MAQSRVVNRPRNARARMLVIGGGTARLLAAAPPRARAANNANPFVGGFRLWSGEGFHSGRREHREDP